MKTAETKTSATSRHLQAKGKERRQPFFQRESAGSVLDNGQPSFFVTPNGNDGIQRKPFFARPAIQTKLTIGPPGDKYEQEADSMAEKVVQRLAGDGGRETVDGGRSSSVSNGVQAKCADCDKEEKLQKKEGEEELAPTELGVQKKEIFESKQDAPEQGVQMKATSVPAIQAKCDSCEKEEKLKQKEEEEPMSGEEELQMKPIFEGNAEPPDDNIQPKADNAPTNAAPNLESRLSASKGGGSSLPNDTRSSMEAAFGADFSGVRVHTGSEAVQMNKELGAQAFTHGSDVYFGAGKYDAGSSAGKGLLAHELTHTVQQGGAIQKKPDEKNCKDNAGTLSIDDVTKDCPSEKGKIEGGPGSIVITINKLRVKSNHSKNFLKSISRPLTLPKSGLRKEEPTNQIGEWTKEVNGDVTKSLEGLLNTINQSSSLADKKKPNNKYSLNLRKSAGEGSLTGSFTELKNASIVPKWGYSGIPTAFQIEHIVDYQIAGAKADNIDNLILLSASVNGYLGGKMREYIKGDIESILSHYNKYVEPGKLVSDGEEARKIYKIEAADFGSVVNEFTASDLLMSSFMTLEHPFNPLRSKLTEMKSLKVPDGHFILKSSGTGTGILLPYKGSKIPIGSFELTMDGDPIAGTLTSIKAKPVIGGTHLEEPPGEKTYAVTPTAEPHTFKVEGFGSPMSQLKLKYLSFIDFSEPTLDEGFNIRVNGLIKAPSPKFLNNTPIEVSLIGRDLSIQKTFSVSEVGTFKPLTIDYASLTLGLSTASGFEASGAVGFSIPKMGKGEANAKGNAKGFTLNGSFNFDTKTFDEAKVSVGYDSVKDSAGADPWSVSGVLTIGKEKVKGVESASIKIGYDNGELTGGGTAKLNAPGVKSAAINFRYAGGDFKIGATADFDFKSKFIENGNLAVSLASGQGEDGNGYSLGISGSIKIIVPKFNTFTASVTYADGVFDAKLEAQDITIGKYITGSVTVGVTNGTIDEATGIPSEGGEGKALQLYGAGSVKVQLSENISSTIKVKLTKTGQVVLNGEFKVDKQPLLNKEQLFGLNREIFKIGTPKFPIFSIGVADIFLRIEGEGNAMANVGVPKISLTTDLKDVDIFSDAGITLGQKVKAEINTEAGIDLGVRFILGASALILEISANIGGALKLHIIADANAMLELTWSSKTGLKLTHAEANTKAAIILKAEITGGLSVDLNLFVSRINVWKKDWKLGELDLGSLGEMGFNFPMDFDESGNPKAPETKDLKPQSSYSEEGGGAALAEKAGGKESKIEKTTEDFKDQILKLFHALPAIGPGTPEYEVKRGRHFFIKEIQQHNPDGDWGWLKAEWIKTEQNEFWAFRSELLTPQSKADKFAKLKIFAQNHPMVSHADIAILEGELTAMNTKQPDGGNVK